jgi:hypothetical protein
MGIGRRGRPGAPGGRVTRVDVLCETFGYGSLESDHGRLLLSLRYLRRTQYSTNITREGGKTVRVHYEASLARFLVVGSD